MLQSNVFECSDIRIWLSKVYICTVFVLFCVQISDICGSWLNI